MATIVPLRFADQGAVGGKGLNLLCLQRLGFRVPMTYVLQADAYREHYSGIRENDSPEEIRESLAHLPLDAEISRSLDGALQALGDGPLAVRSSATSEDGALSSFAGQHESILGVRGKEECLLAIRKCWASLWNERSISYRQRQGGNPEKAAMAVLIQPLIPAQVSGVLFTMDPVTGRKDRVIIEAVPGLGALLVSGEVSPDRFVLDRRGKILERRLSSKQKALLVRQDGSIEEVKLEGGEAPSLSDAMIRKLARLGRKVAKRLGGAQDLEWAIAGGKIHLLQARPVTTGKPILVWSNTNTGEVLPDVATPMTFSLVNHFIVQIFEPLLPRLSELETPLIGLVAGRVYFNLNVMSAILLSLPFLKRRNPADFFGGLSEEKSPLTLESLPEIPFGPWPIVLKNLALTLFGLLKAPRRDPMDSLVRERVKIESESFLSLSDEALFDRMMGALGSVFQNTLLFPQTMLGVICSELLGRLCRKWFDDGDGRLLKTLFLGMGCLDSAEAGLALGRLATQACDSGLGGEILATEDFATLKGRMQGKSGNEFFRAWEAFMSRHGHHARAELDVFVPRWRETPDYILHQVKGFLAAPFPLHPLQRSSEREELEKKCRESLNPVRRLAFDLVLKGAQRGIALRENLKSEMVRRMGIIRFFLLEAGNRLERGTLEERDDVFFLNLEELKNLLVGPVGGGKNADLMETVRERRREYEYHRGLNPPSLVVGEFQPEESRPDVPPGEILKGIAVSPGIVTGRARVILRADQEQRVLPGEILVAPFTDPGWTPYFLPAAGIVVDQGGVLSHGSIVAREYGLPAVVNVGKATCWIKTGQMIQVDGFRGEVRIFPD